MAAGLLVFLLVPLMQGVSCATWGVNLPERLEAITESCITIPCSFTVPEGFEPHVLKCTNEGFWLKGSLYGPRVLVGTKPSQNKIKGYIAGDLKKKDCTTVFQIFPKNYSDMFFFRLECPLTLFYNFAKGIIISAQSDPSPPGMSPVKQVSEGHQATLQCSAPLLCSFTPPTFTWMPKDIVQQETKHTLTASDGQEVIISTVTFNASARHHNQSVSCSVSYPLAEGSTRPSTATQRLSVMYAPRSTAVTLIPSGPFSEGSTVALSCSSDANPPVSLHTWYRAEGPKQSKVAEGEVLTLRVTLNDTGLYLCEAQNTLGSQRSSPVRLEITTTGGISQVAPYAICGLLFILLILIVAVGVIKYQSLSRRLKRFELQGENTYANLRNTSINSGYDHIQRLPQTKASSDPSEYENMQEMKLSKINSQQGSKGLS